MKAIALVLSTVALVGALPVRAQVAPSKAVDDSLLAALLAGEGPHQLNMSSDSGEAPLVAKLYWTYSSDECLTGEWDANRRCLVDLYISVREHPVKGRAAVWHLGRAGLPRAVRWWPPTIMMDSSHARPHLWLYPALNRQEGFELYEFTVGLDIPDTEQR